MTRARACSNAIAGAAIFTVKGGNGSLRFRQRFLTKSHLVSKHILDSAYGVCVNHIDIVLLLIVIVLVLYRRVSNCA